MKRYISLTLVAVAALSLGAVPLHADCTCSWEVRQLSATQTPGDTSDCPMLDHENQQNAGFWADNACVNRGGACTFVYSSLSCTANPDGSATATGLVNYKCNQC
jgi:hypothetical protein